MSSLVIRNNTNEANYFLKELSDIIFDAKKRTFGLEDKRYQELPEANSRFLESIWSDLPLEYDLSDPAELHEYFRKLLLIRERLNNRLQRTLYGVHRAIVAGMLTLNSNPEDFKTLQNIRDVLLPEWRSHLDDHLDKIDALAWFETWQRKGTVQEMPPAVLTQDREMDIKNMVDLGIQQLQLIHEGVKTEIDVMGEVLRLRRIVDANSSKHITLGNSSSEIEGTDSEADYEQNLLSDANSNGCDSMELEVSEGRYVISHLRGPLLGYRIAV